MRRIFHTCLGINSMKIIKFNHSKIKFDISSQPTLQKHSLFSQKTFPQIINLLKNPQNPYPKNAAYYYAILQYILEQSNQNSRIMLDYGEIIHIFIQDVMDRIRTMSAKELSEILTLLRFRPKTLRFDKQLLITMHIRFQARMKQLILINQQKRMTNDSQILTLQDVKNQIDGLFYLKKNTSILNIVLTYCFQKILQANQQENKNQQLFERQKLTFYRIIQIVNDNLDDTIDPVRQGIAQFIQLNHKRNTLWFHRQTLRMISKCKFYKNYPIVRYEDWIHQYVYQYLKKIIVQQDKLQTQQVVNVLRSSITYVLHIDPASRQNFMKLLQQVYQISNKKLFQINYLLQSQQLSKQLNTISQQIKLIPSFLYLKHYYKVNTIQNSINGNKVSDNYIKLVIKDIKPIIKKFILCYLQFVEMQENGLVHFNFTKSIEEHIESINSRIQIQPSPEKSLLKSVQNLLNTVSVFKDFNLIQIDPELALILIQTQLIYCILCRKWIPDQVRYLRLLQHAVFVIGQFQTQAKLNNPSMIKFKKKVQQIKIKFQQQLSVYDNMQKNYKQFTVLRLVSVLKSIGMQPQYLADFYKNIKFKKPNIYVQTLSRTMLKHLNSPQVIDAFQLMFQGKIPVKEIELGRIVFLSSKQPLLLKYWINQNRKHFINKVCFNRRIMNNIVSIIRMDNLQINRNSIQLLAQIVIQNKLFQIQNYSISNHQESNALKKILCTNFSILFRYSKMDSMIQDVFIVNKNAPTKFKSKFTHIENIKVLTFSAYLSEEQSIFYINRENKNALFKYVIMLMKTQPFCQRRRSHYLLGQNYSNQNVVVYVVNKIIQQYWPDNKLTNKGMPFYAEFLNYFTKTNRFDNLIKNQNTIFLIIKQILQDYKEMQQNKPLNHLISRLQLNYEKLHILSIFQNQNNVTNTLENVLSSMNFVMDLKIFGEFTAHYEKQIKKEIQMFRNASQEEKKLINSQKQWKKHSINKHLVNLIIIQKINQFDYEYTQSDLLTLLTVDIMVHGIHNNINQNMQIVMKKLLKINPTSIKYELSSQNKKKYPFQLFKVVLSNLTIYLQNRNSRLQTGKQIISQEITNQKVIDWVIKCLLTYAKEISHNEQLEYIFKYLNDWNIDILSLVNSKYLSLQHNLQNIAKTYFNVEYLYIFFKQNLINYNQQKPQFEIHKFTNQIVINYINTIANQIQQTHLINSYAIYFCQEGQKLLNIMKTLILTIIFKQKNNSKLYKSANETFKRIKQLFEVFNKITNKTIKYNKLRTGGKYSYLYNENQGEVVDMFSNNNIKKHQNRYNQQSNQSKSVSVKIFSKFSQMLEIISMVRINKWGASHFSEEHKAQLKKINDEISKRQKGLLLSSQVTYFMTTEPVVESKTFNQFDLTLYVQKKNIQNAQKTIVYYLVDQKESMLYDFSYKKRRRLAGQQQLVIDYIQTLIILSKQKQKQKMDNQVQIKIVPHNLSKSELKKLFSN